MPDDQDDQQTADDESATQSFDKHTSKQKTNI